MTSRRTKISPKSGRGLGHVTPTILAVRSAILATAWLLVVNGCYWNTCKLVFTITRTQPSTSVSVNPVGDKHAQDVCWQSANVCACNTASSHMALRSVNEELYQLTFNPFTRSTVAIWVQLHDVSVVET